MFKKLKRRIIIITMVITTVVLVLSGTLIMILSSAMRPEPKPRFGLGYSLPTPTAYDDQELKEFIENDRKEGDKRLLNTLLCVGAIIEVATFSIIYFMSREIVEPVKATYDK